MAFVICRPLSQTSEHKMVAVAVIENSLKSSIRVKTRTPVTALIPEVFSGEPSANAEVVTISRCAKVKRLPRSPPQYTEVLQKFRAKCGVSAPRI